MNHSRRCQLADVVLVALLTALLSGCWARRGELIGEIEGAGSDYAAAAVAAERAVPAGPDGEGREDPVEVLQAEVRARHEEWLRTTGDAPRSVHFYDFGTPEARRVAERAADLEAVRSMLSGESGDGVDVDTLIVLAFTRSPAVEQALEDWRSVLSRYDQAVFFDDVLAQYNAFATDLMIPFGPMEHRGREPVGAILPPPGALAKKGDVLDAEAAVARDAYRVVVRDLVTDVRLAFEDLIYIDRAIRVTSEARGLLGDLKGVVEVKYEAGSAEYSSLLRTQSEFDEMEDRLITLRTRRRTVEARLRALLDLGVDVDIGSPRAMPAPSVEAPTAALVDRARIGNQELDVLRSKIAMIEATIRLAEDRPYYKYVQRFYRFDHRGGSSGGPEPRPPVPYWFGQMDAFLQEMRIRLQAAREGLDAAANRVAFAVEESYFEIDAQRRLVDLYADTLVANARQSLEASRTAYQAARVGFLDVLDAERKLLQFELTEARARRDLGKETARLAQRLGDMP